MSSPAIPAVLLPIFLDWVLDLIKSGQLTDEQLDTLEAVVAERKAAVAEWKALAPKPDPGDSGPAGP